MRCIVRRIFYDKITGNILLDTGERRGLVKTTTIEEDIANYVVLSERIRATFGAIELSCGQYAQDFTESNGYRVNPETKQIEFSYPDPNEPEVEQPNLSPLSESVNSNMEYLVDVDFRLSMIEMGLQ
ncbi:hypothetical protein [Sporosarcina gallistercoris]|uniref:Uncharacterized protein n=1 Tax=Sporosarcina gallistercoris TaxID=2762245 RepID=A0ABR8PJB9_9BACL|nr:hypothetical protein [Sporosarcina gallistercoris]MBD7908273.1 hypothetical protein [Sporosarcina gallistercoris]